MKCSYCGDKMHIATVQVKRPVPSGAKDLNLHDSITSWQCTKCGQTSQEDLKPCERCNKITTLKEHQANLPIRLMLVLDKYRPTTYGCTECENCWECHQPLRTHDYIEINYETGETSHCNAEGITSKSYSQRVYRYYHSESCYKRGEDRAAKIRADWLAKKADEERKKQRQIRIQNCLCITCGKPLGVIDKAIGRQQHKVCP